MFEGRLSLSRHMVDHGRIFGEDVQALPNHSGSVSYVDIRAYSTGRTGESDGIGSRQYTTNNKVRPIRCRIGKRLGLGPRQRVPAGTSVELWLGTSTDKAVRMTTFADPWTTIAT